VATTITSVVGTGQLPMLPPSQEQAAAGLAKKQDAATIKPIQGRMPAFNLSSADFASELVTQPFALLPFDWVVAHHQPFKQRLDGQVARGVEAGPEAGDFVDRQWNDLVRGYLDAYSAEGHSRPAQAHRPALQKGLMKAASDLAGSVGELVAQGSIGDGDPLIDGGTGRPRLEAGLTILIVNQAALKNAFNALDALYDRKADFRCGANPQRGESSWEFRLKTCDPSPVSLPPATSGIANNSGEPPLHLLIPQLRAVMDTSNEVETTMQKEIDELSTMPVGQLRRKYLEVFGEESRFAREVWNGLERNLSGISFAVANVAGWLAQ
jgi:hypothetical protein